MHKISCVASTVLIPLFMMVGAAHAQYVGPNQHNNNTRTVAGILKAPYDDQRIVLEGFILKKIGHEKYIFSDNTAEIRVDIDDEKMPHTPIDDKMRVQIHGDVDVENHYSPQIDVDAIIVK